MNMVSITGKSVRVAHTSGHVLNIGMDPVDVSEDVPGLLEHALSCGCMPFDRLQEAIAARAAAGDAGEANTVDTQEEPINGKKKGKAAAGDAGEGQ